MKTKTGKCEGCGERKETRLVQDDWRTRLETLEMCRECTEDE